MADSTLNEKQVRNTKERDVMNVLNQYNWPKGTVFTIDVHDKEIANSTIELYLEAPGSAPISVTYEGDELDEDDIYFPLEDTLASLDGVLTKKTKIQINTSLERPPGVEKIAEFESAMYHQALESILFNLYGQSYKAFKLDDSTEFVTDEFLMTQTGMSARALLGDSVHVHARSYYNEMDDNYALELTAYLSDVYMITPSQQLDMSRDFAHSELLAIDGVKYIYSGHATTFPTEVKNDYTESLSELKKAIKEDVMPLKGYLDVEGMSLRVVDKAIELGLPVRETFAKELAEDFGGTSIALFDKMAYGAIKLMIQTDMISEVIIDNIERHRPDNKSLDEPSVNIENTPTQKRR